MLFYRMHTFLNHLVLDLNATFDRPRQQSALAGEIDPSEVDGETAVHTWKDVVVLIAQQKKLTYSSAQHVHPWLVKMGGRSGRKAIVVDRTIHVRKTGYLALSSKSLVSLPPSSG